MGSVQYLRERRKCVEKELANVRNFEVFTLNYLPAQPIERPEMDQITRAILKYERSGIPTNIFIFGSRGCGKTMTLKHMERLFNQDPGDAKLLYVSARGNNTSFKMLAYLLNASPRGVSMSELFERFRKAYPTRTVIIIDEIDFISEKDPHREILYLMSRAPENYTLILLANNPKFADELDSMTRSSLAPIPLHFPNYDAVQIEAILRQRAETGLNRYPAPLLKEIAALITSKTNSDVRVAIKTLYYAATERYCNVQESFENAQRDLIDDLICDLNYNNILVLKAILRSKEKLVKEVFKEYLKLCVDKHEKAFGYTRWYHNLSYLQSIGLVLLVSTKIGKTYTNRIDPLFEEALLKGAYEEKIGSRRGGKSTQPGPLFIPPESLLKSNIT